MERRKFSGEEKYQILEEGRAPEASIAEVCRRHQISSTLYYRWEKQAKAAALEALKRGKRGKKRDKQEERLREKISRLRTVVSEITEENLTLKKRFTE